jgi:hypothetical protein
MITIEKRWFFNTIRALFVNENLKEIIDKKKYSLISIISYQKLNIDDSFYKKQKKIVNIYLDCSMDDIFKRFNHSTQLEIKKTYKMDGFRFEMEDENLSGTYNLYKEFEYAQGRIPWRLETFKNTKLFNAYYNDELISAIPCYDLHPYLQARAMSSGRYTNDKEMQKIAGYATRRLILEICKYAKDKRYVFFGLGSINQSTAQKANVSQFKGFFGGRVEDEYHYTYKSGIYRMFEKLISIKILIKRIFRL